MTGQLKVYSFSSSTPFMFSASTCHSATTYDSNMALYTHDGQMMIQNDTITVRAVLRLVSAVQRSWHWC